MSNEVAARLAEMGEQLGELQDLFRRRLLDDREKRQTIDTLWARVELAEKAASANYNRALVASIALVIDRLESHPEDAGGFLHSVVDELEDVLRMRDVVPVEVGHIFDPRQCEVTRVDGGDGSTLLVTAVLRRGYEKNGVVLRPAQVAVVRRAGPAPTEADPG